MPNEKLLDELRQLERGCDCEYDYRCGRCERVLRIKEMVATMFADRCPADQMYDVAAFHHKFGIDQPSIPREIPEALALFRLKFLLEEVAEIGQAMGFSVEYEVDEHRVFASDPEKLLDGLVDLNYVSIGTALAAGLDFDAGWHRVQMKNMQKERALPDGSNSLRFSAYDVVKPEGWTPPDHSDLVDGSHIAPVQQHFVNIGSVEPPSVPVL